MDKIQYIKIKGEEIPVCIRSYKNAKEVKMYFKAGMLKVSRPKGMSDKQVYKLIKSNKSNIYATYQEAKKQDYSFKIWHKQPYTIYEGEEYTPVVRNYNEKQVKINLDKTNKIIEVLVPKSISEDDRNYYIDRAYKKFLTRKTKEMLNEILPYWSKKTNLTYKTLCVRFTTTRYGSCVRNTQELRFSARLILYPMYAVEAVIVHEFCHFLQPNHKKEFYDEVKKILPDYDEREKVLKKYGKLLTI